MNLRELVDRILVAVLPELVLRKPIRWRRRARSTRSNPCGVNEFRQALLSSETLRTVDWCGSHKKMSISQDEWVRLVKTLGWEEYQRHSTSNFGQRRSSFSGGR
jgi:hypothetical protein